MSKAAFCNLLKNEKKKGVIGRRAGKHFVTDT